MAKSKVSRKAMRNMVNKPHLVCNPTTYDKVPIQIPEGKTCEDYIPEKSPDLEITTDPFTITMCCCTYTEWTEDLIHELYFITCANKPKVVVDGVVLSEEEGKEYMYNIIRDYNDTH